MVRVSIALPRRRLVTGDRIDHLGRIAAALELGHAHPRMAGLGIGESLVVEIVNQPEGTLLLHSMGTYGHGGAFGTEGWIDPKNDLIRIVLVQLSDSTGSAARSIVMQMGEAAVLQ